MNLYIKNHSKNAMHSIDYGTSCYDKSGKEATMHATLRYSW